MSEYSTLQGNVEIARNTFTGVDKFGSFQQGVEASQKFEFVDNVVEFTGSSTGFGAEFLSAMVPTGQAEFDPMVISGNRFFSTAPTGDLNSGATLHLGAYWTPGEVRQTPGIMFVNNSVERHQSSTNTNALLFIESDYTGGIRMSESTFEANPGASSISNNTYGADASVLAIDHVTSRGSIVATFGVNVSISNSAIDGLGSPAVTSGNDAVVIGEGNVVAGESSVLAGAKTVDDLLLGDLADIGLGASFARVPLAGSPVLDAGVAARSVEDQRGVLGARAGLSDAGSVEVQRALVTVGDAGEVAAGSDARFPVTVVEPGDTSFDVELTTVDGTAVAGSGFTSTTQTVS
ncbi:hypothetical protein ICL81_09315, partial [Leucobacter sp. cx-328]|uniref:choice-of-anchor Q domain-containing protein n=1 Tax=unclassified Leucobacter TaxID=2621730 RepID=UPI00165E6508|nr:hypothetical protein [Leucobacter sp. cx-328]